MASVPTAAKTKAKAKTKSATFPELAAFVERIDAILANHTTANTDRPERFGRHSATRTAVERYIYPLAEMNLKFAIEEMTEEHPDQADKLHGTSRRIGKFIARLRRFENRPERSANHPDAAEVVRYEVAARQLRELKGDWNELKANDLATLATIASGETPTDAKAATPKRTSKELMMLQTTQTIQESEDWSASRWGEHLGVKAGTVKGYKTWKSIMRLRKYRELECMERDEERAPRPRNRRRKTAKAEY